MYICIKLYNKYKKLYEAITTCNILFWDSPGKAEFLIQKPYSDSLQTFTAKTCHECLALCCDCSVHINPLIGLNNICLKS